MTNRAFLSKIYSYQFVGEFVLILPLFAVMFADAGLTTLQISFLFLVWSGTSFILDVPAGILADKYSRKYILALAQLAQAICFTIWIFYPTFYGFLIGNILWGLRDAFTSGTFDALLYDELKASNQQDLYTKTSGRARSLYFIATMLASLSAIFAVGFGYPVILMLSAATSLLAGLIILRVPTAPKARDMADKKYFALAAEGFSLIKQNSALRFAVLRASITALLSMGLFEFWMLTANQAGLPHWGLGLFLAIISGVQAVSSSIAHRHEQISTSLLYSLFILGGIFIIALGWFLSVPALALIFLFNALFTFLIVLFNARLQHTVSSETRATILSVSSFITRVGIFAITLMFGFLASRYSYNLAFDVFGCLIVAIGTLFLLKAKAL